MLHAVWQGGEPVTKQVLISDFIQINMRRYPEYRRMAEMCYKSLLDKGARPGTSKHITFAYKKENGCYDADYINIELNEYGIFAH